MKKAFLFLLQFVVFLLVYAAGSFAQFLRLVSWLSWLPVWHMQVSSTHVLVVDGLVFATLLFVVILAFEAARRVPRVYTLLTTIAFAAALLFGLLMKFGMVSVGQAAS